MVSAPGSNVDMSLDEIVSSNKNAMRSRNRRGRGRMFGSATVRNRQPMRTRNYNYGGAVGKRGGGGARRQLPEVWDKGSLLNRSKNSILQSSAKEVVIASNRLMISNLNFAVTDDDIKELFSTCGQLKKAVINYDNTGHSNGTAEVVYFDRKSAQSAYNSFNGVCLDKRPLKIQYLDAPDASKTTVSRLSFPPSREPRTRRMPPTVGGGRRNFRGGRGGGRQGRFPNRRGGGAKKTPKSGAALDQEMIDYQNNEVEMK